jgi:hypothetical protein
MVLNGYRWLWIVIDGCRRFWIVSRDIAWCVFISTQVKEVVVVATDWRTGNRSLEAVIPEYACTDLCPAASGAG